MPPLNPVLLIVAVAALMAFAVVVRLMKRDATGRKDYRGEGGHNAASRSTHNQHPSSHDREASL